MSQTVERALTILVELGDSPRSIGEIADRLGVHKSTALRLLQTLEAQSFVHQVPGHRYRLGSRLFTLGQAALEGIDIRLLASEHLEDLNRRTGQTVHLGIYEAGQVIYVDKYESRDPVRMYSRIGKQAPLHCTGVAKAIVAFLPGPEREQLAETIEYPVFTPRTINNPEDFLAELERIRDRGFAVDDGEHEELVHCVAAPIRETSGAVRAAVSLSAVRVVVDHEALMEMAPLVLETADSISRAYGWRDGRGRVVD